MAATDPLFTPFATAPETLRITPRLCRERGLDRWARDFSLGTAGYRDLLDPADLFNPEVPFNGLNVAVMLCARAQLALEEGLAHLHVGGEVRPHTQAFIDLAARIYAAQGITVHLRPAGGEQTTPIWLSSFGVNHLELDGGENFTASHSQSYKGGWKPMDDAGMQLLELAGRIAERTRFLAEQAADAGLEIPLAPADDPLIVRDFDPYPAYVESLRAIVPPALLDAVPAAAARGFRCSICTEGGSMGAAARRVFGLLGIGVGEGEPVALTHEEESDTYHGIGVLDGVNHGVDPGKWQIYKHVGAQERLRSGEASVVFLWDPDGDRFNMVTVAPAARADALAAAGLEVEPLDADRCLVYFRPNQIYFMLTAVRLEALHEAGTLRDDDWIVATTWPTSRSIGELAEAFNRLHGTSLKTFRVPVGFKWFGQLVSDLEQQVLAGSEEDPTPTRATDVTGETVVFGPRPRLLIMAEESGGAAMGPDDWQLSVNEERATLAIKEKDAMQIGVACLGLAARLHLDGSSFGEFYVDRLDRYGIVHRFYERQDITLFDESLRGEERARARAAGNRRKAATVDFFASLEGRPPAEIAAALQARWTDAGATPPEIVRCFHAGDGTLIEFDGGWFELRASGTDAVLRYYLEGREAEGVHALNTALTRLDIDVPEEA